MKRPLHFANPDDHVGGFDYNWKYCTGAEEFEDWRYRELEVATFEGDQGVRG